MNAANHRVPCERRGVRVPSLPLSLSMLLLGACGPVAIGAGIAGMDSGGGGGGTSQVTAAVVANDLQPDDDATLVAFNLAQGQGLPARARFEYDAGDGRRRIAAANLVRYDAAGTPGPARPDVDAEGNFELPTRQTYLISWRHAADLGVVERRGVSLYLVFGLAKDLEPTFASGADGVSELQLFGNRTVGRELSELSDLVLSRESSDPESEVVLRAVLQDRGGDRERTTFALRYAVTDPPAAQDFVALPPLAPTAVTDSEQPDGRVRSELTFKLDPTAAATALPIGRFELTLEVQHRETYGPDRGGVPPAVATGAPQLVTLADAQVGHAPVIEAASVVDPTLPSAAGGDPGKPWLRLPIALKVFNPSPSRAITVRTSGTYALDNQVRPITPFVTGDPLSAVEFVLQPLERTRHYLVWNVVRDEGLGNTLVNDPPYSPLRTASLAARVELVAANGATLAGDRLANTWSQGLFTTLSTNPFVDFRDNLEPSARRVWSSGNDVSQRTRDLFFTQVGASSQETRILLDQQFEPVQIVPPPPVFDFNAPPLNFTNGVYDIAPTDVDPAVPDCVAWVNGEFFHVRWPDSSGAVPTQIGSAGPVLANRGRDPATFTLTGANGPATVVVFFTWSEQVVGTDKDVTVQFTTVRRDTSGWSVQTHPQQQFELAGTPAVNISAISGEFDGDATDRELVLGTLGTEYATPSRRGLLAMWSFSLDASGAVVVGPRTDLQAAPPPSLDPARAVPEWLLARWRDDTSGGEGLVLVRQLDFTPTANNRQCDAWVLLPASTGGTIEGRPWTLLSDGFTTTAFPDTQPTQLRRVFAEDLDANADGIEGSDLILVFDQTLSGPPRRTADVWLFAHRGGGAPQWRRLLDDVEVADPVTLATVDGGMDVASFQLVDVNGDRLLDLLTSEGAGPLASEERHYNYFASSLSGVAGTFGPLANTAGDTGYRSTLPGLIDANEDGLLDVITGSRLHLASLDGAYTPASGNFTGAAQSRHQIERLFLDGPPDSLEVIVADATNATQNRIDRIGGIGGPVSGITAQSLMGYELGGTNQVQRVRALMAPDTETRRVKDLVGVDGDATSGTLRRVRIDPQALTATSSAMWPGTVAVDTGFALVRREPLASSDPAANRSVQDVVVVDAADRGRLVVLVAGAGYAPSTVDLPGSQIALRLAEASVGDDTLEDVCVLTEDADAFRLLCLQQDATGVAQALPVELARFARPFATASAVRTFQLDRGATRLASGLMLIDDTSGGSGRSEARLVRPILDGTQLAARIVRSPLSQAVDVAFEVVVTDADGDGLIEVIGGEQPANNGLRRLRTNVAPPGN